MKFVKKIINWVKKIKKIRFRKRIKYFVIEVYKEDDESRYGC